MTFNYFGRVVIGSLWETTAHRLNKEHRTEENNEGENNDYVVGVTLKATLCFLRLVKGVYGEEWRGNLFFRLFPTGIHHFISDSFILRLFYVLLFSFVL